MPVVWRRLLIAKAMEQFCYEVGWGDLDELIVDLPPGTGDVQLTLVERLPIHGALFIKTPQQVALLDVPKAGVAMLRQSAVPILGVVANMVHHRCEACGHDNALFPMDAWAEF